MEILSKQNEKIKNLRKLQNKKERKIQGVFVVETEKLIQEAVSCGYEIEELYFTCDVAPFEAKHKYKISEDVMKSVSSLSSASKVLAVVRYINKPPGKEKFLVLENIQDPSNVGAIIRTAFGAGFNTVYCIDSADAYECKALRSSMGAIFHINLINSSIEEIKQISGVELVCASMEGENIYKQKHFGNNVGVVIGNEGNGVSENLKSLCSRVVSIPMQQGLESLNASISAGLIMYAISYNLKEGK